MLRTGEKIRQLRIFHQMTQQELVTDICSTAYLSKIEKGTVQPSEKVLMKLADRFQVPTAFLGTVNHHELEKRIQADVCRIKKKELPSKDEVAYLRVVLLEFLSPEVTADIFLLLLRYYTSKHLLHEADELYAVAYNMIQFGTEKDYELYLRLGFYFYRKQEYTQTDYYYTKCLQVVDVEDKKQLGKSYYNMSIIKQRVLPDVETSILYSQKALSLFEEIEDHIEMGRTLITLAVQNMIKKEFQEALNYLKRAKEVLGEETVGSNGENYGQMIQYNLARIYQEQGKLDEALHIYEQDLRTNKTVTRIYTIKHMILIYIEKKHWDLAYTYLIQAFELAETYKMNYILSELHKIKADIFWKRGDVEKFEGELKKGLDIALKSKNRKLVTEIATRLGDYYVSIRFYKKAAYYYKKALS
ncbi:helix-turn-helix domain-containing protein [Alkalihalobacillus pseudalcaliphilus]|uniref:helix-turn-helix domain-containing protein n=1 Tax=Alkalihalobacillus pseudalcaliphilus TaxID=79884 RepID=UPI00064DA764|nr:helix-turn-helix transcriptional regulator [Alkalihalobacillus pseudalcaliphilus]KMK77545.1 hypothetical protein AB990_03500 [Alkalihalobacillus pseudalcaliphilus]